MTEKQEAEWLCAKALEIAVQIIGPAKKTMTLEKFQKSFSVYEEAAGWAAKRIAANAKEMVEMKMI
jgi:hypothetical protein